jgi:hypothetical protein
MNRKANPQDAGIVLCRGAIAGIVAEDGDFGMIGVLPRAK